MATGCPHCGHKKFDASAEPVRRNAQGVEDAWENTCKSCGGKSVFDSVTEEQVPIEQWSP